MWPEGAGMCEPGVFLGVKIWPRGTDSVTPSYAAMYYCRTLLQNGIDPAL